MLLETLRLIVVGSLLVVLPGFLLVQATMPPGRVRLSALERIYLTLAGGVLLVMLVGIVLGFMPHDRVGHFQTLATGRPNAELILLGISALLFYIGLARGAYPRIAKRLPQLSSTE